jgi:hypothetical protein
MKEKLWPSITRLAHAKKTSIQDLIGTIHEKICEEFTTPVIIQYNNEISMHAAAVLWHPLEAIERETCKKCSQNDIALYKNLMETLNSFLVDDTLQVLFSISK